MNTNPLKQRFEGVSPQLSHHPPRSEVTEVCVTVFLYKRITSFLSRPVASGVVSETEVVLGPKWSGLEVLELRF